MNRIFTSKCSQASSDLSLLVSPNQVPHPHTIPALPLHYSLLSHLQEYQLDLLYPLTQLHTALESSLADLPFLLLREQFRNTFLPAFELISSTRTATAYFLLPLATTLAHLQISAHAALHLPNRVLSRPLSLQSQMKKKGNPLLSFQKGSRQLLLSLPPVLQKRNIPLRLSHSSSSSSREMQEELLDWNLRRHRVFRCMGAMYPMIQVEQEEVVELKVGDSFEMSQCDLLRRCKQRRELMWMSGQPYSG